MTLTAADIQAQGFRVTFRGYAIEQVDAFLDRVQQDLVQQDLVQQDAVTPRPGGSGREGGTASWTSRILAQAEEMAAWTVADAAGEADGIRKRAHAEAEQILAEGRAEVARVDTELRARRHRELDALAARAERLRAELARLTARERRCQEELRAWFAEHEGLLNTRSCAAPLVVVS